ncbi:60S ribosomal protein L39-like [Arvicola amphibius]|uniref:60S ribosomal protein L39-like n=1 Tax=Arvicola amphibius TaxID=1047088 RepID=UPI001C08BCD4|nr:60S ribosomal protein L39-like [Arvicola amphibius]
MSQEASWCRGHWKTDDLREAQKELLPSPHPVRSTPVSASRCIHKTLRMKRLLDKKQKQNLPVPQGILMEKGNKVRYNSKRRSWKRTRLGL